MVLATSAMAGVTARVTFCAKSLAKPMSRSENTRTTIFRPFDLRLILQSGQSHQLGEFSSTSSFCRRTSLLSSTLLRICSGTSQS